MNGFVEQWILVILMCMFPIQREGSDTCGLCMLFKEEMSAYVVF